MEHVKKYRENSKLISNKVSGKRGKEMKIETNYALKLFFPKPSFIQIYFEAVANALDAKASEIEITIKSDGKIRETKNLEIIISDNGVGFTEERFDKFKEVKEPTDPYHKGMGRLVYLKYFSSIEVESYYENKKRIFTFTESFDGESKEEKANGKKYHGSKLTFKKFMGERIKTYDDLKPISLKAKMIEHFMPILLELKRNKKQFRITINLETETSNKQYSFLPNKEHLSSKDIPEFKQKSFKDNCIDQFNEIQISYWIRKGGGNRENIIAACIDGRTVPLQLIQKDTIPIDHSVIFLFESELFNGKTDSSRQKLVLPENISEAAFHRRLRKEISKILNEEMPIIKERNEATKKQFDEKYPHLLGYFDEDTVGLINRDEAIEIAQNIFFKNQKEILDSESLDESKFKKSLEIASRTLTEYVLYRELIIKRLKEIDENDEEKKIHSLIVPQHKTFHDDELIEGIYNNNAWLLDDKFMTFRTILSEARMEHILKAISLDVDQKEENGRPDIAMVFSADPSKKQSVDVVVIEIKRKKVNDKENMYATTQLVKRARKLINNCKNIQRIWYYAVIEIDEDFSQLLKDMKWMPLFSKGKVFYQEFQVEKDDGSIVPTPTYLLSYDAIINDAAARNHTFLQILKHEIIKAKVRSQNNIIQIGSVIKDSEYE